MTYRRALFASALLVACKGDAGCFALPCPAPFAALVTIAAADAPGPVAGAQLTVNGQRQGDVCRGGQATTCDVFGGTGKYDIEASAPGYATARVSFTVTGSDGGCNSCAKLDRQFVTVTLQPATHADRN